MSILILAEHNNLILKENTFNTLVAAKKLGNYKIDILIIGYKIKKLAKSISQISNINKILIVDSKIFEKIISKNIIKQILLIQKKYNYSYILSSSSIYSKSILPEIASKLNIEFISDIIKIKGADIFKRLIYTGNIIETIKYINNIKIINIRTTSFKINNKIFNYNINNKTRIKFFNNFIKKSNKYNFIKNKLSTLNKINLNNAKIIISGGKGLGSKKNFNCLIIELAKKLNAAVGASRSAIDYNYITNDFQIGQSGKIVAPKIYIAIGISGAIQHLVGMKDSKIIIAINNDIEAPIFSIANYGIVGDLFKIVPKIIEKI